MKMSRRALLFSAAFTAAALALPAPALATGEFILTMVKDADGIFRVPAESLDFVTAGRAAILEEQAAVAYKAAVAGGLSMAKANGLLTRLARPTLASFSRGGIVGAIVQLGLTVALNWAISDAVITNVGNTQVQSTMPGHTCSTLPVMPASVVGIQTGVYQNTSSGTCTGSTAVQVIEGGPNFGTVTAPAGWAKFDQRSLANTYRYVFTKAFSEGQVVIFPAIQVENTKDAVPGGPDTPAGQPIIKQIADAFNKQATNSQLPLPTVPGANLAEPGTQQVGTTVGQTVGQKAGRTPVTAGQLTGELPAVNNAGPVAVQFPPGTFSDTDTTPTPGTGTGTTTTPPTTSGPVQIDWGTPPAAETLSPPTPMSWMPTPFTAPSLPGSCTGVPLNFRPSLNWSGVINPCPVIDQARPILRPVAIAGWTTYAITTMLDL